MKNLVFILVGLINSSLLFSQVSINSSGDPPNGSAMLDVSSTTRGFLPPRMTQAQRTAITTPAAGLLVFQTDAASGYYFYTGANWVSIESAGAGSNSSSTCIDYDSNAYPTITIGTQIWMAENLRVTHYNNGDAIPIMVVDTAWQTLTTGAYCWYNNNQTTNGKYGILYNWYTIDDSRGLCPTGWHVPSDAEWTTLTTYVGLNIAGGKMKSISSLWFSPNVDATNNSGFSALPGGGRYTDGSFNNLGNNGYWWSSTEYSSSHALGRSLTYNYAGVHLFYGHKPSGFALRCLKD